MMRTPKFAVETQNCKLAERLQALSKDLEDDHILDGKNFPSKDATSTRYHDLAHERHKLINKIRTLDGFDNFLRPQKLADLLPCARAGPIVTINVSQYRCDALALVPGSDQVLHIPLEQFSAADANKLLDKLHTVLRKRKFIPKIGRGVRSALNRNKKLDPEVVFQDILSKLWTCVAKPVLDGLDIKLPSTGSPPRVWWCLTGPLVSLPIHAAGLYRTHDSLGSKLSDFVVSSYIPSMTTLLNGMRNRATTQNQILAVALPIESKLPNVMEEIDSIGKNINRFPILQLMDSDATAENVTKGMKTSSYVHFACHGMQDIVNPTDSALLLSEDSRLSLSEIAKLKLSHGELAYLSACQTATGDDLLTEESVHLAAGLLAAGYRGVIGTMWSISDNDAPIIANQVYRHLFKDRDHPDSTQAAYALSLAVKHLREESVGRKSFLTWVPFIHLGV